MFNDGNVGEVQGEVLLSRPQNQILLFPGSATAAQARLCRVTVSESNQVRALSRPDKVVMGQLKCAHNPDHSRLRYSTSLDPHPKV
jgi:hypothetical protein